MNEWKLWEGLKKIIFGRILIKIFCVFLLSSSENNHQLLHIQQSVPQTRVKIEISFAIPKALPLAEFMRSGTVVIHLFVFFFFFTKVHMHTHTQKVNNRSLKSRKQWKIHKHALDTLSPNPQPSPPSLSGSNRILTGSDVPDNSRSLTVRGKLEESCDVSTSEGCVILALPIGKPSFQPPAHTGATIVHMQIKTKETCLSRWILTSNSGARLCKYW